MSARKAMMTPIFQKNTRRSIRLKTYDYATPGAYFITICIHERKPLLGIIVGDKMRLNSAGRMIENWFDKLSSKFPGWQCDTFICMPNHVHCILVLHAIPQHHDDLSQDARISLHTVIQWFKTMTTNEYIREVKLGNFPSFNKRLWQRNYWEHVIRDEDDLDQMREYILYNPLQWDSDEFFLPL